MRKFAALMTVLTATTFAAPMAMAKGKSFSAPKTHASRSIGKAAGPQAGVGAVTGSASGKAKRATPPRGAHGRFVSRKKA